MFDFFFFGKNKKKKEAEKVRLSKLETDLKNLGPMPFNKSGVEYALDFFNKVSFFQDQGKVSFAKNADEINSLINYVGRQGYGWNRTKPGETVTIDNLYCGNRYGLFTHPLRYWMESDTIYIDFIKRFYPDRALEIKGDPYDWQVMLFFIIEPFISEKKEKLLNALKAGIDSL